MVQNFDKKLLLRLPKLDWVNKTTPSKKILHYLQTSKQIDCSHIRVKPLMFRLHFEANVKIVDWKMNVSKNEEKGKQLKKQILLCQLVTLSKFSDYYRPFFRFESNLYHSFQFSRFQTDFRHQYLMTLAFQSPAYSYGEDTLNVLHWKYLKSILRVISVFSCTEMFFFISVILWYFG